MAVEVENRLPCFAVGVDHQAIPPVSNILLVCQTLRGKENVPKQLPILLSCIVERGNRLFRHDENVHRRLRSNVAEGDNMFVFVDDRCRYFSADDLRKNAIAHTRQYANRCCAKIGRAASSDAALRTFNTTASYRTSDIRLTSTRSPALRRQTYVPLATGLPLLSVPSQRMVLYPDCTSPLTSVLTTLPRTSTTSSSTGVLTGTVYAIVVELLKGFGAFCSSVMSA